jgi:predicted RNA-binding protein YlqC (UPF0109 family)
MMKDLLHFVTSYLVDLQVYVAPDDMGKVIGRNGRVAKALRELIRAAAMREGKSAIVEIIQ